MDYQCVLSLSRIREYLSGAAVVGFDFETAPMEEYRLEERAALDESGLRQKEKALCDHGISVRLAEEQDVKRLLVSYYLRDADPESLEGVDGERAVTAFG